MIEAIVKDLAPELLAQTAIGLNSAAQLLLTAGDNPDRLKSETSFAALCSVSPGPCFFRGNGSACASRRAWGCHQV